MPFYLWHVPIRYVLDERMSGMQVRYHVVAGFLLSLAAAEVSWRLVEAPFLRLKSRFAVPGLNPRQPVEPACPTSASALDGAGA
jgi:peptidoglycan/LPS O-acetylase OafA/YrhL